MRRNSTQIELITPGATTWLPWISDPGSNRVDGYPNFDGFTGQSRSIRESAWQDFLDSGEELEIIPDPEPPPPEPSEPEPDWEGFLTPFYNPPLSGSSFDIIESRVQTAWINAAASQSEEAMRKAMTLRTHWQNCLMGLTNPTIRSREWLSNSWSFLQLLMSQCAVAIPADELKYIQELFQQYNLL